MSTYKKPVIITENNIIDKLSDIKVCKGEFSNKLNTLSDEQVYIMTKWQPCSEFKMNSYYKLTTTNVEQIKLHCAIGCLVANVSQKEPYPDEKPEVNTSFGFIALAVGVASHDYEDMKKTMIKVRRYDWTDREVVNDIEMSCSELYKYIHGKNNEIRLVYNYYYQDHYTNGHLAYMNFVKYINIRTWAHRKNKQMVIPKEYPRQYTIDI